MTEIFPEVLSYLLVYKYAALFFVSFIAAFLIPVPASTMLAAAGGFAARGYFNFFAVLAVAFAANLLGDFAGYVLARRYGEPLLQKIGFGHILRARRFAELRDYIHEFPNSLIYFSRFLTEVGPTVNVLSGLVRVPYRTFFTFEVLGEASYVMLYASAGYYLGTEWENNAAFFAKATVTLLSIGLIIMLTQLAIFQRRRVNQPK